MSNDDAYSEAQTAQTLRDQIHNYAYSAVKYGRVDRDWVNGALARLGAEPVTGSATYRINIPVTGLLGFTINADDRAAALVAFNQRVQAAVADGVAYHGGGRVFEIQTGGEPHFFSGPQDVPETGDVPEMTLDELKAGIRKMLMDGVTAHGWGHAYAVDAVDAMGLEPLPPLTNKTVEVPVTGTHRLTVPVFEGADDEAVQRAAQAKLSTEKLMQVSPEEVGEVTWARSSGGSVGLHLVDDEDGEDEPY